MSFGAIPDVAIGIALTYLLLALIATSVQESIAALLAQRGKALRATLEGLLEGTAPKGPLAQVTQAVLGHPLLPSQPSGRFPSYVPVHNVATALIDVLADGSELPLFSQVERGVDKLPPGSLKDAAKFFLRKAGGDLDKLHAHVEAWVQEAMDRASGIYRRKAQLFAFIIGAILAVSLNVDSIGLSARLYGDSNARQFVVAAACVRIDCDTTKASTKVVKTTEGLIKEVTQLPIGWTCPGTSIFCDSSGNIGLPHVLPAVTTLLGWLITALAVSLGAPFWFDMLQKLFNLRASGPKPNAPATKPTAAH